MNFLGNNNPNVTFESCWRQLPLAFRFYFIASMVLVPLQLIFQTICINLCNIPYLVFIEFHIWSPFLSMFWVRPDIMSILNILFAMLWLYAIMPKIEKKYSSLYMLIDVLIQNLTIQLMFLIIMLFGYLIRILDSTSLENNISGGWWTLLIIYLFKQSYLDPQNNTRFCCLPCLIPQKYIPWIVFAFMFLLSKYQTLSILCAGIIGFIQAYYLKGQNIIKFPFSLYNKLEYWLGKSIKDRPDYISVKDTKQFLKTMCYKASQQFRSQNRILDNDNNSNRLQRVNEQNIVSNVEVAGGGISIGSSSKNQIMNPRDIWLKKAQQLELQVQPKIIQNQQNQNQKNSSNQGLQDQSKKTTQFQLIDGQNSSIGIKRNKNLLDD